tara:strand:+ start:799 stop:939 length:141 start_codon:yes stop_codon:yes gene_type:complete
MKQTGEEKNFENEGDEGQGVPVCKMLEDITKEEFDTKYELQEWIGE